MEKVILKQIEGIGNGLYWIGNDGFIYKHIRGRYSVLTRRVGSRGDYTSTISDNGISKELLIKTYVYKYFRGTVKNGSISFLNGNSSDIRPGNLKFRLRYRGKVGAVRLSGKRRRSLDTESVLDIRRRLYNGETQRSIYNDYDSEISWWSFRDICRGNSYKDIIPKGIDMTDSSIVNRYSKRPTGKKAKQEISDRFQWNKVPVVEKLKNLFS